MRRQEHHHCIDEDQYVEFRGNVWIKSNWIELYLHPKDQALALFAQISTSLPANDFGNFFMWVF